MLAWLDHPRTHHIGVPLLLLITATIALTSLITDSVTFDETSHLTAGLSVLRTGDYRLAPDHPPLAKIWCAAPLLLLDCDWPPPDDEHWASANVFQFGREFLFQLNNGQRLVVVGRCMMVVLLLATCLTIYFTARLVAGPRAALFALTLAALSPTLLAHGRLVTTDLPITLMFVLVLLTFAHLFRQPTWQRFVPAAIALAAASVTKLSWPLVLPSLAVMLAARLWQARQATSTDKPAPLTKAAQKPPTRIGPRLTLMALLAIVVVWAGIWTVYGWRHSIAAPPTDPADQVGWARFAATQEQSGFYWQLALHNDDGTPRAGLVPTTIRLMAHVGLLPDSYLLGLAQTLAATSGRCAYLCGSYGSAGWWVYFPVAILIKTPVPVLLLIFLGTIALARRKIAIRHPLLLVGLITFAATYLLYVMSGSFDIGHRHVLPIYPTLFVLAGAAVGWLTRRAGRIAISLALLWLVGANFWIHPHYLPYFNELVGGPARGHRYLADSNIDWGQDLLRLADYVRQHPDEQLKLGYFGSAVPTSYVDCSSMPSFIDFEPRAELSAGTYVISVNRWLGVNDPELRPEFWTDRYRQAYQTLQQIAESPPTSAPSSPTAAQREQAAREYHELRYKRLISRLRLLPPDARVGYSLLVYRLTDAQVAELTAP